MFKLVNIALIEEQRALTRIGSWGRKRPSVKKAWCAEKGIKVGDELADSDLFCIGGERSLSWLQ